MGRYRSGLVYRTEVDVEVDLADAVADMSASERNELAGLLGTTRNDDPELYVRRAYDALTGNRPAEALAYLERHLFPRMILSDPKLKDQPPLRPNDAAP